MVETEVVRGKTKRHELLENTARDRGYIIRYYVIDNNTVAILIGSDGEPLARGVAVYSPVEVEEEGWVRLRGQEIALGRAFAILDREIDHAFPIVLRTIVRGGYFAERRYGKHLCRAHEQFHGFKASCHDFVLNAKENTIVASVRQRLAEKDATSGMPK